MNNEVEKLDLIIETKTITNNDLAGTVFDNYVSILTDGTSLLRIGFGSTGIGLGFKLVLFVRHLDSEVALAVTKSDNENRDLFRLFN